MPTIIPEETEGSLIVLSDTPDIIVTNITDLKEIEAYLLLRDKPEHIIYSIQQDGNTFLVLILKVCIACMSL